jgi:hypothetical protein
MAEKNDVAHTNFHGIMPQIHARENERQSLRFLLGGGAYPCPTEAGLAGAACYVKAGENVLAAARTPGTVAYGFLRGVVSHRLSAANADAAAASWPGRWVPSGLARTAGGRPHTVSLPYLGLGAELWAGSSVTPCNKLTSPHGDTFTKGATLYAEVDRIVEIVDVAWEGLQQAGATPEVHRAWVLVRELARAVATVDAVTQCPVVLKDRNIHPTWVLATTLLAPCHLLHYCHFGHPYVQIPTINGPNLVGCCTAASCAGDNPEYLENIYYQHLVDAPWRAAEEDDWGEIVE